MWVAQLMRAHAPPSLPLTHLTNVCCFFHFVFSILEREQEEGNKRGGTKSSSTVCCFGFYYSSAFCIWLLNKFIYKAFPPLSPSSLTSLVSSSYHPLFWRHFRCLLQLVFPFLAHSPPLLLFSFGLFYANFCYEIVWRFDFDLILFFASVKINLFTTIEKYKIL